MSTVHGAAAEYLSVDLPLFLVHRSYQYAGRTHEVLDYLADEYEQTVRIGAVARLPKMTPNSARSFADSISHIPIRIMDPELWRHPDSGWRGGDGELLTESKSKEWPYLSAPPEKPSRNWVKSVLDIQRNYDASILLSATGWVPSETGQVALQRALSFVRESREQVGDGALWVNLAFDYTWLTDKNLLNILIEEIVESTEESWYLRFWWPEVKPRYGQLRDVDILEGYKVLARECDLEEKRLYLPNTGLTGWAISAIGASGFSTGTGWNEQAFARQPYITRPPGLPYQPPIARLFDALLLHTIEYDEYQRIRDLELHKLFMTPFLEELETKGHSAELAGLHYLAAVGILSAELASRRPERVIERRIRDAANFVESLSPVEQLSPLSRPQHLSIWSSILE